MKKVEHSLLEIGAGIVVLCLIIVVLLLNVHFEPDPTAKSQTTLPSSVKPYIPDVNSIDTLALSNMVNSDRSNNGLQPLTLDTALEDSSKIKCDDMVAKNYWAHVSPNGTQPWDIIKQYTNYLVAGENLAFGELSATAVNTAWMNSTEHRDNILNPRFMKVGYDVCLSTHYIENNNEPSLIVVQHLIG